MRRPQPGLADGNGPAVQRLGRRVVSLYAVQLRQIAGRRGRFGVLRAENAFTQAEGFLEIGFRALVIPLVLDISARLVSTVATEVCSLPRVFSQMARARWYSGSAAAYLPWVR